MTKSAALDPPSHLMAFILGLLAPLLMTGSLTDISLARLAAAEAIAAYGKGNLMTIGQILAFALTALDNLRLSMPPDLSLSMKLKLRGNANALNRSARDNTQILENQETTREAIIAEQAASAIWDVPETPDPAPAAIQEALGLNRSPAAIQEAPGPNPADIPDTESVTIAPDSTPNTDPTDIHAAKPVQPTTANQQNNLRWATAMTKRAAAMRASAAQLPPAQQKTNMLWVDVLTGVATDLILGKCPTANPGTTKTELMRTTLMAGGSLPFTV
jgi:hypothetical protein